MTTLMNANTGLHIKIVVLTSKAESERSTLWQELQNKKGNTILQKKSAA